MFSAICETGARELKLLRILTSLMLWTRHPSTPFLPLKDEPKTIHFIRSRGLKNACDSQWILISAAQRLQAFVYFCVVFLPKHLPPSGYIALVAIKRE